MLLKQFGNMGIRQWDGTPKGVAYQRWQQALALRRIN
jgi:hypothetical protein